MTAPNPFARPAEQPQQPAAQPASPFPAHPAPQQPAANPYGQPQQPAPAAYPPAQQPQAYAPPAPPAYVPQQPAPATAYGSQWPAGSTPAQAPGAPVFGSQIAPPPPPAPSGEKGGADLLAMFGCLVLWMPTVEETVAKNPRFVTDEQRRNGQTSQQRMTATVVVLDNPRTPGLIEYGGNPYGLPPVAHTDRAQLPYVRKSMWINQGKIIGQLRSFLRGGADAPADGSQGMTIGRVNKVGPGATDPWFLDHPTDADHLLARQYVEAVQAGHLPNPLA